MSCGLVGEIVLEIGRDNGRDNWIGAAVVVAARKNVDGAQERTCALTRVAMDPSGLVRFVAAPDGTIAPDLKRKLPGRGVWITARADCVARAAARNVFARSLKQQVSVDPDLARRVDDLMLAEARQSLALANKAGLVVHGAMAVEKLVAQGKVAVLVHAADGGRDGARKMLQALRRHYGAQADLTPVIEIFDSAQLDLALGHANVIHAALKRGAATQAFLVRCQRLAAYRGVAPQTPDAAGRPEKNEQGSIVEDK